MWLQFLVKKKDKSQKERMPLHNSKCTLLSAETPWGRGTCTVCLEIEFFIIITSVNNIKVDEIIFNK